MVCKLCNLEKGKLCKAHLIPESFYRYLYQNNKVEGSALYMVLFDKNYLKKSRIGLYDENILCKDCDNSLGQLDGYGKRVLLDCVPRSVYSQNGNNIFVLDNVDVPKLSLFFLSVLWRCSISLRPELSAVSLGTKFNNKIKDLLCENSVDISNFSIVITQYDYINNSYKKSFLLPASFKIQGLNYYHVYFPNGYKILIKIDSRPQHIQLEPLTLKQNYPAYVVNNGFFEKTSEYLSALAKVEKLQRNR